MAHEINFAGKTFAFNTELELSMAQQMLDMMKGANKGSDYIAAMLAGMSKTADKAEKHTVNEAFTKLTAELRETAEIKTLVNAALAQFAKADAMLGVKFNARLGKNLMVDLPADDTDTLYGVFARALGNDGVTFETWSDDETKYVRVLYAAKEAIATVEKANTTASNLATSKGLTDFKVKIGDGWYPEIVASYGGGSAAGGTKTRFVKLIWHGKEYDGLKADVAKALIADGLPNEIKVSKDGKEIKLALSGEYYSKWLDNLNEAAQFAPNSYEKYNKTAG